MTSELAGSTVTIRGGARSFGSTMVNRLLEWFVDRLRVLSRDEAK